MGELIDRPTSMDRAGRVAARNCFALVERDDIDDVDDNDDTDHVIERDDADGPR